MLWLGLGLLLISPLIYVHGFYFFASPKVFLIRSGFIVLAIIVISAPVLLRVAAVRGHPLSAPLLVWCIVCALSVILSEHKWAGIDALISTGSFAMGTLFLLQALPRRGRLEAVLAGAGIIALIASLLILIPAFGRLYARILVAAFEPFIPQARALLDKIPLDQFPGEFPFSNPNVAASFLILPVAVSFALALFGGRRVPRWVRCAAGLLLLCSLGAQIRMKSLGALIGAVAGCYLCLLVALRRYRLILVGGLLTSIVIVTTAGVISRGGVGPLVNGFRQSTAGVRPLIWSGSWRAFGEHPILGSGLGSFFIAYAPHEDPAFYAHPFAALGTRHAHSQPLHLAVETGLIGVGVLVWLIVTVYRCGRGASQQPLLLGLIAGVTGVLIHSLVSVAVAQPVVQWHLCLAVAAIGALYTRRAAPQLMHGHASRPAAVQVALVVATILIGAVIWKFATFDALEAQRLVSLGIHKQREAEALPPDDPAVDDRLAEAAALLERGARDGFDPAVVMAALTRLTSVRFLEGRLVEAVGVCQQMEGLAPNYAGVSRNLGVIYRRLDDPRIAAKYYVEYLRKDRFDVDAYRVVYELSLSNGYFDLAREAVALLDYAIKYKDDAELRLLRREFQKYLAADPRMN